MTVSSETARIAYAGSGSAGPFAIPFRFEAGDELLVVKFDIEGARTVLTHPAGFSATGAGLDAGGSLTLTAALASGETLAILNDIRLMQLADYVANDTFPASVHEAALDKLTRAAQKVAERVARSLQAPEVEAGLARLPTAASRANRLLGFDANGSPIAVVGGFSSDVPVSAFAATLLDDANAAGARSTLDAARTPGADVSAADATGYVGYPVNTQNGHYTLVAADAGKQIQHLAGSGHIYNVPANSIVPFPLGTEIKIINGPSASGALNIDAAPGVLLYSAASGLPPGNWDLAINGIARLTKFGSDSWMLDGEGIAAG